MYSPRFSSGKNFVIIMIMCYSVLVFIMGSTPYLLTIFISNEKCIFPTKYTVHDIVYIYVCRCRDVLEEQEPERESGAR